MEQYLKKELALRTAKATDGFYMLTFDNLSISFFKGELKIKGVELQPNQDVFQKWQATDSLPPLYVRTKIGTIDFKGVNFIWRRNYKLLHFNSFEIKSPEINLFAPQETNQTEERTKNTRTKTLYEIISPYISVLSVKKLNLEHATISYTITNTENPIFYELNRVNFHAYGFRLDEYSSESGKLLYCDNFDFSANQPQSLIRNNEFILKTDSIQLGTQDSVIYIRNVSLVPQKALWNEKKQRPANYIDGLIRTIHIQGIRFRREHAQNYLHARTFEINSAQIDLFGIRNTSDANSVSNDSDKMILNTDSLIRSLSLYQIISPVLNRISIDQIRVKDTKLSSTITNPKGTDRYLLNDFSLQANNFQIDSVDQNSPILNYFQRLTFDVIGIEGIIETKNQYLKIKQMSVNTENRDFKIKGILFKPLSTNSSQDYISGKIDSIRINKPAYDSEITAAWLDIHSPDIQYIKKQPSQKQNTTTKQHRQINTGVTKEPSPFPKKISIQKVNVTNGRIDYKDQSSPDTPSYHADHIYIAATHVTINTNTKTAKGQLPFTCSGWHIGFTNFRYFSSGKKNLLSVRKGLFNSVQGIELQDILLKSDVQGKSHILLETPFIKVNGFNPLSSSPTIRLNSIETNNLCINYANTTSKELLQTTVDTASIGRIHWNKELFNIQTIQIIRPLIQIEHALPISESGTRKKTNTASIYGLLAQYTQRIIVDTAIVSQADIKYTNISGNGSSETINQTAVNLSIEGLNIHNIRKDISLQNIRVHTRNINIPLSNGFYDLKIGTFDWENNNLKLDNIHFVSPYSKMEFAYAQPQHKDWFDVKVGSLSASGIDLPSYFTDHVLKIDDVQISRTVLQNFKNKKIEVQPRIIPMIYSGLQKAPVKLTINNMDMNDLSVIYEELAPKGTIPGKLFFTQMNGKFTGFTNIVHRPDQYIKLDANGKLMGKGYFTATWMLPVDSLNDRFVLNTFLDSMYLPELNQIVTPLAPARIESGQTTGLSFSMEASSKSGNISLVFPYKNLKIEILKGKNEDMRNNVFLSRLANMVLKHNNPEDGKEHPRIVNIQVERDPYHSTFNYLWQIIRPALTESVGVSQKQQKMATEAQNFISKVKHFFKIKLHKKQATPIPNENKE